jgi:SAM-dependent methyltransferase
MSSELRISRIRSWRSRLGPNLSPYENRLPVARWFFYQRLEKALQTAGPIRNGRVLEIGCWEGYFLPSLLANYSEVWAIDNDCASVVERITGSWTILQLARELCETESCSISRLRLTKADGRRLPFRDGLFDAVFCLDTLPYIPEEGRGTVISEVRRVLKPSGSAVFTLPVELGMGFVLRQVLRRLSGSWLDDYSWQDWAGALLFSPPNQKERRGNLIGYDYRRDEKLIGASFSVRERLLLPLNVLGPVSPTVLLSCRN